MFLSGSHEKPLRETGSMYIVGFKSSKDYPYDCGSFEMVCGIFLGIRTAMKSIFSSLLCQLLVLGGGTHTDVEQKHSMWLNLQLRGSVEARLLTPCEINGCCSSHAAVCRSFKHRNVSSVTVFTKPFSRHHPQPPP